ncbi:hypothetical protein [Xylanibacter brevis]|uniref:hypothetical protein n=1 Tax=Xylanibacter brevis TaxID=83231 RepID=UPI00048A242C|nr:hypothetical protein [Xylanibacter brevis]
MTDRALHEALRQQAEQHPMELPSNFAYTTMRRIAKEQQARQRHEKVVATVTIGACSLLGIGVMGYCYGEALLKGLYAMLHHTEGFGVVPGLAFCCLFLATLNYFLRRHFSRY